MQVFRQIYVYNQENPVYSSSNAKTFNCRNTQTGENRLILVRHSKQIPKVEQHANILQPIESPTSSEPVSVYPLVHCVSQISTLEESDAMYILKNILQSPQKDPKYYVVSPNGICTSNVQGILPEPSPRLYDLISNLLNFQSKPILSRECTSILKGLKDGQSVLSSVNLFGWKQKKDIIKQPQFWIFKGRRKQEGILSEEYGLCWKSKVGIIKFKPLQFGKGDIQRSNLADYMSKIQFYIDNDDRNLQIIKVHKITEEMKMIKLFVNAANQGTLNQYLTKRKQLNQPITQEQFFPVLGRFVETMKIITSKIRGHTGLHIKYVYMDRNNMLLGEPMLISDKTEKKLRELRNSMDYFSPELKQNVIIRQNVQKLDHQKMDIWSFGFILHKIFLFELPVFDPTRKVILKRQKLSSPLAGLITKCLSINPSDRPKWSEINFEDLSNFTTDIIVKEVDQQQTKSKRQQIKLDSRGISRSRKGMKVNTNRDDLESRNQGSPIKISTESSPLKKKDTSSQLRLIKQEEDHIQVEQQMVVQRPETPVMTMPVELSSRLKKIKLFFKIIVVLLMYLVIFFRPFLTNTINILTTRGFLNPATLYSLDTNGNIQSSTTILTSYPQFFMLNDITFSDIQDTYHCINNQFDPIYNPNYSLNSYIQTNYFIGLIISGWLFILIICIAKGYMIWKGGIGNKSEKQGYKYWVVYVFNELCMAMLLFSHFYLYDFFYFSTVSPCFGINAVNGIEPFFDSILYLFLTNINGYLVNIITTVGIFSFIVLVSVLVYSCSPKNDVKNFFSVPSIIFRILPYLAFILISRVGLFQLYSPTTLSDPLSMIPALLNYSFIGFLGIIPQIFIVMCIAAEFVLEMIFYYCQKSASKSDTLNRLFNTDKKKVATVGESLEQIQLRDQSYVGINKNSLDVSELKD